MCFFFLFWGGGEGEYRFSVWDSGVGVGEERRGEERRWDFIYIYIDIDIDINISILVYSSTRLLVSEEEDRERG